MSIGEVLMFTGLLLTVVGLMGTMWWRLSTRIAAGDAELHARVNKTREEYVRRDDLGGHLDRIDKSLERLHDRVDRALEERRRIRGRGE